MARPDSQLTGDVAADLLARFTFEAERAGGVVHRCSGIDAVVDLAVSLAAGRQVSVSATATARYPELIRRLSAKLAVAHPTTPEEAAMTSVGVSAADALVAETGSLLVSEHALADRLVSMLSQFLIEVVPADAILPTLDDVGSVLSEQLAGGKKNYNALMTGPSRSADIERSLTVGVQGPYELHIAILEMPK